MLKFAREALVVEQKQSCRCGNRAYRVAVPSSDLGSYGLISLRDEMQTPPQHWRHAGLPAMYDEIKCIWIAPRIVTSAPTSADIYTQSHASAERSAKCLAPRLGLFPG